MVGVPETPSEAAALSLKHKSSNASQKDSFIVVYLPRARPVTFSAQACNDLTCLPRGGAAVLVVECCDGCRRAGRVRSRHGALDHQVLNRAVVLHDVDNGPIIYSVDLHLANLLVRRIHDVAAVLPLLLLLIVLQRIRLVAHLRLLLLIVLVPSLLLDVYHGLRQRVVVLLSVRASYRTESLGWR